MRDGYLSRGDSLKDAAVGIGQEPCAIMQVDLSAHGEIEKGSRVCFFDDKVDTCLFELGLRERP